MQILLCVTLWGLVHLLTVLAAVGHQHGGANDPHGGVPMGIPNSFCDDGYNYTYIDWDPSSSVEYTCQEDVNLEGPTMTYEHCDKHSKRPVHICYPEEISYDEDIPTSGPHRPLWPQYGEYRYLPIQRWLHSLEVKSLQRQELLFKHQPSVGFEDFSHGAVVFLYNPCADPDEVRKFKAIAKSCMRRHIITPSKRIRSPYMFALASWMCKMTMTHPDVKDIVNFVRQHALHSPERSVYMDGQYSIGLIHHAKLVSDKKDSNLCPGLSMMALTGEKVQSRSLKRQSLLKKMERAMERDIYPRLARTNRLI